MLVPAGRRFDWPKLRAHLGVTRMSLPDADEAQAATGYVRYTITPFGSTHAWPVILDASAADLPQVAIGGGAFGVNVHLAPAMLIAALDASVVDVTTPEAVHASLTAARKRPGDLHDVVHARESCRPPGASTVASPSTVLEC